MVELYYDQALVLDSEIPFFYKDAKFNRYLKIVVAEEHLSWSFTFTPGLNSTMKKRRSGAKSSNKAAVKGSAQYGTDPKSKPKSRNRPQSHRL